MELKYFFKLSILCFVLIQSCFLEKKNDFVQTETWINRTCCEYIGAVEVSEINISADSVQIEFCNHTRNRVYITLDFLSQSTNNKNIFKIALDSVSTSISIKHGEIYSTSNGSFFHFDNKLKDGRYYMYLTKEGCGVLYFNLIDGKFISERNICIHKCKNQ